MAEFHENEWETSSGLPLADIDAEIIAASFGYNAKIQDGTVLCANLTFQPDAGGDPIEQSFSVGQRWELDSDGILVADDGRKRTVNSSTNYGRLIDSAVAAVKAAEAEMPFASPRDASGWIGTKWHVGTTPVPVKNPSTGKEQIKDAFVFTAYYGKSDETAGSTSTTASSTKPAAKGKSSAAGDLDADLRAKLEKLAKDHDDHDAFVDAAYDVPGVDGNKAAEKAILASNDNSLWAQARKG